MLIIGTLASIYNLIAKNAKKGLNKYLCYPFLIYFLSIIISFIIDVLNNQVNTEFLQRNISILIIPLFIFSSNFSKKNILNIIKITAVVITFIGLIFLTLWTTGYYKYNNQQEFQKKEWFKNELITNKEYTAKNVNLEVIIKPSAQKPSLRKVVMLTNINEGKSIIREFIVKSTEADEDLWVLLRNVNNGNSKAWFNVKNGKIGQVEGKSEVKSEKISDGFYKFTLANKLTDNSTREWFYISFVSDNGSYNWSRINNENVKIQLRKPSLYLDSGENLLQPRNLFNYKITNFSNLETYAHSTYFGLIFLFALIVFLFDISFNYWVRGIAIFLNIFFVVTLASKAVIISLVFLIPIYYLMFFFNYKYLIFALILAIFIGLNGHIKERLNDMFTTVKNIKQEKELGDLERLSTNNRIVIYKNYVSLIQENYILGYGYKNGADIIKSKFKSDFNSHNQYLQSIFHAGITGFFLLMLFCLSPFILIRKKNKTKFGLELFIILILFNFLFESMLFRQWGLILVSFIYAIYFQFFKLELRWFQ